MLPTRTLRSALSVTVLAAVAQAGELRRDFLPAGTEWVAHADVEALVESELYRQAEAAGLLDSGEGGAYGDLRGELLREIQDEAAEGDEFAQLLLLHDFDPLRDFRSVTLFGELEAEDEAVLLLELGPSASGVLDDLRARDEHLALQHDGVALDAWLEDDTEVNGYLFAAPPREDGSLLVAVSEQRAPLVRAARVLTGEGRSLMATTTAAQADAQSLRARAGAGSFFYLEVVGDVPGAARGKGASRVLSSARALRFDLGERSGALLAQLTIEVEDDAEALRISQVVQGVVALASLAAGERDEAQALAELADAVRVQALGREFVADFELPSIRLVEMAQEQRNARQERRDARRLRREEQGAR